VIGLPAVADPGPWAWHPYPVLWAAVTTIGAGVALVHRRLVGASAHPLRWERARILRFIGALVVTVVAMGWPLGDIAAHRSLSALVLQRCILVLAVAPLLLTGLPDDVIRWLTRPAPVDRLLLRVLRPPVAVVTVTVLLVGSMAPVLVAAQSNLPTVRGLLAVVAVVAGLVLWLPIIGRIPGIARPRPMIRAVYLVAQAVVPVFLSFIYILATRPLYPTLSHSRGVIGLAPLNDQQVAGFVSKLSFLITLLAVAAAILVRAPDSDDDLGPEDPLVWADVERHFERADRRAPSAAEPGTTPVPDGTGADGLATGVPRDVDPEREPEPGTD
jgi:cytochrome c oxidase assembly factor CtaG